MPGRTPKITSEQWVNAARKALVTEGVAGLKVDRLARTLGVTRGGFFHNFKDRDALLSALLHDWEDSCHFLPDYGPGESPAEAVEWIEATVVRLIEENGYDHDFDMAVREWARADRRVAWAVQRADKSRMKELECFFRMLGYSASEAPIRARVFYYHQIGYYAIGVKQSVAERRKSASVYLDILCGPDVLLSARQSDNVVVAKSQG
jgi:AcrR family transcriptional regulator